MDATKKSLLGNFQSAEFDFQSAEWKCRHFVKPNFRTNLQIRTESADFDVKSADWYQSPLGETQLLDQSTD